MKADKKTYLISSLIVIGSIAGYFIITKNKNKKSAKDTSDDFQSDSESTTQIIDFDQEQIPITLIDTFNSTLAVARKNLIGKKIYSKVANIKARRSDWVNDGLINNVLGLVPSKNIYLGTINNVYEDATNSKNASGRVYKWVRLKLSEQALTAMKNADNSFFTDIKLSTLGSLDVYFREDVISLINKN